MINGMVDKW